MEQSITGFQYSVSINQLAVLQGGFDIDVIDVGIIDAITHLYQEGKLETKREGDSIYFKLDWEIIPKRLPLFGLNGRSSVKARIQKLTQRGFLVPKSNNVDTRESWLAFGESYHQFQSIK